jgi:hypothetical protein
MSRIAPWFLALCVLVIICAIGTSIVYSFHGFKEGFSSDSCDDCEDDTECSGSPEFPRVPQDTQGPMATVSLSPGMDQNIAVSSPPLAYSIKSDIQNTDAKFKNLLNAIHKRTGSSSIFPTTSSLHMASGVSSKDASGNKLDASGSHVDASGSRYTPNQITIRPDQHLPVQQPTLTANVPTDAGTGAQTIMNGATLTPSVRQMIRNDVKNAVKDGVNEIGNEYEITYEQV